MYVEEGKDQAGLSLFFAGAIQNVVREQQSNNAELELLWSGIH